MNLIEILEKTLIQGYATTDLDVATMVVCIFVSTLIGTYIYTVYKTINRNSFYNKNFNLSLIALSVIISAIILTIQANIVVSLGMVGALSIVRFRTAVKDPLDLVFLFWAISAGIICGAGYAMIAILASIGLTIVIIVFSILPADRKTKLIVINATDPKYDSRIMEIINQNVLKATVRSRTASIGGLNMAIEGIVKNEEELQLLLLSDSSLMMKVDGATQSVISSVSIIEHNGDITA